MPEKPDVNADRWAADPGGMRELGVALVGAGWVAQRYARALERVPGTRLVGVASRSLARARELASAFGAPRASAFGGLEDLLADPGVDFACICSPNFLHAPHALAALRAGRPVLVEKPFCLTLDEADALLDAANRAGLPLGYAENLCFAPHYARARELVASGALGPILSARQVERHGGPYSPWFLEPREAGGGALMDLGCHGIGVLLWILGAPEVAGVRARLARRLHAGPLEDEAHVELELADGRILVSESGWTRASGMESRLELIGGDASLEIDLLGATGLRIQRRDGAWEQVLPDPLVQEGYVAQLAAFAACIRGGTAPEGVGGREGRAVLEVILAAYASAVGGGRVALPLVGATGSSADDCQSRA